MTRSGIGVLCVAALVLFDFGVFTRARAATLEFEDIFGPCPDNEQVIGPGNPTIEGVHFTTPDIRTVNFGKGPSSAPNSPFLSDWFEFQTYNAGATITFPQPVTSISFVAGFQSGIAGGEPTIIKLRSGGTDLQTFSQFWTSLTPVSQTFSSPVSSVVLQWVSGPQAGVGMDTLTYTPAVVPEPATAVGCVLLGAVVAVARKRRRLNCVTTPRIC